MPHQQPPPTNERTASDDEFARRLLDEHLRLQHAGQLTAAEVEAVRALLDSDKFWKRLIGTAKTWAVTVTAVVAAWTVGVDVLKNIIKNLGR